MYEITIPEGSGKKPTFAVWVLSSITHERLYVVPSSLPHRLVSNICLDELASVSIILTTVAKAWSAKQGDYLRISGGDNSGLHVDLHVGLLHLAAIPLALHLLSGVFAPLQPLHVAVYLLQIEQSLQGHPCVGMFAYHAQQFHKFRTLHACHSFTLI